MNEELMSSTGKEETDKANLRMDNNFFSAVIKQAEAEVRSKKGDIDLAKKKNQRKKNRPQTRPPCY